MNESAPRSCWRSPCVAGARGRARGRRLRPQCARLLRRRALFRVRAIRRAGRIGLALFDHHRDRDRRRPPGEGHAGRRDHGHRRSGARQGAREKQLADIRAKAAADAAATLQQLGIATAGQMVASVPGARARSMLHPEQVKTAMKAVVATSRAARRPLRSRYAAGAARVRHRAAALQGSGVRRTSQRLRADARAQGPPDHPPEPRPDHPGLARMPENIWHRRGACATACPTARPRSRS